MIILLYKFMKLFTICFNLFSLIIITYITYKSEDSDTIKGYIFILFMLLLNILF